MAIWTFTLAPWAALVIGALSASYRTPTPAVSSAGQHSPSASFSPLPQPKCFPTFCRLDRSNPYRRRHAHHFSF